MMKTEVLYFYALFMTKSGISSKHSRVEDRWIFIFIYPVLALMSVHVGNSNTFYELLAIPSYYSDLLLAFVLTYGIGFYFRWFFFRLDQRFNWENEMPKRLAQQMVFGVILPIVVLIGLEMIYLEFILKIPISDSSVLYLELPLVFVFCVLINLIYTILYLRKHHDQTTNLLKKQNTNTPQNIKTSFVVHAGIKSLNIPTAEIAYFIILQKSTFLVTPDGKKYLLDLSLDQIREQVSETDFIQLNRQIIASGNSIVSFERTETRKLKIELSPPPEVLVFVSKAKAPHFLKWVNQN